jgi:hypothetical protein
MSIQLSLNLFANGISSAELESGPMHSDKPDGLTIDPLCLDRHPVKVSLPQDSGADLMTNATSGRTCSASSESFNLARSLESKLARNSPSNGGILWQAIWSRRATPQQRSISQRRAVVRPTIDRDYSGWLTPTVTEITRTQDGIEKRIPHRKNYHHGCLSEQAVMTSWATPISHNAKVNASPSCMIRNSLELPAQASLTAWPTPHLPSGGTYNLDRISSTGRTTEGKQHHFNLMSAAKLTSWPTPTAMHQHSISIEAAEIETQRLGGTTPLRVTVVHQLSGTMPSGTPAEMGNIGPAELASIRLQEFEEWIEAQFGTSWRDVFIDSYRQGTLSNQLKKLKGLPDSLRIQGTGGQLNPALPRWLMGLPPEWDKAAIQASRQLTTRKKHG